MPEKRRPREVVAPGEVVVNDRGAERIRGGHPWIYEGDILGTKAPASAAGGVSVRDRRGRELGLADLSPQSKIRLRMIGREAGRAADAGFFRERLQTALRYRERVVRDSDAYRLVAAEADSLPGLIVDRYGSALVVQTLTWAMDARQELLLELLEELVSPTVIVERNEAKVRKLEGLELRAGVVRGEAAATAECTINGLRLAVDLLQGQKTGSFLDQRENWAAAAAYATRFGSRRGLDMFTYQGGFALHLARAGVAVEAVDSSRPALEAADANGVRNELPGIDWVEANAFELLRDYEQRGEVFDVVVLDPPAFAKSRSAVETAVGGYKEINLRALKLLRPGGLLITCSCSHHMSEERFLEMLTAAGNDARRRVTVIERRGQAADHPVLLGMPESRYLKCVIATVQ